MNKKVLILGASSDIGLQTVNRYLKNNWSVVAHFSKNNKELKKIKNKNLEIFKYDFKKINNFHLSYKFMKNIALIAAASFFTVSSSDFLEK